MKNLTFLLTLIEILIFKNVLPQTNPRMQNPDYAMTIFNENFEGNFRNNWAVNHMKNLIGLVLSHQF